MPVDCWHAVAALEGKELKLDWIISVDNFRGTVDGNAAPEDTASALIETANLRSGPYRVTYLERTPAELGN
jgi:hypothetical protein